MAGAGGERYWTSDHYGSSGDDALVVAAGPVQ
jgi:hypothetical protein